MQLGLAGVSVMLAMPTHRDLPPATVRSLLETQGMLFQAGLPFCVEWGVGSSLVHHARTKIAYNFLRSNHTHLFWVDSDIAWAGKDFLRLLALATKLPCVGAIYTSKSDGPSFCLNIEDMSAVLATNDYGCFELAGGGFGLGFTVLQRKVIEELAERAPKLLFPDIPGGPIPHIFRCDDSDGHARGEDMAFFADVRALGYKVNLDPTITLGHWGPKEYRASILDHLVQVEKAA